eukprot:PITA_20612
MRKNLISVSALEDIGYEVLLRGGQVLMYPRGTPVDSARVIGVRHAKVYKFAFQPLLALSSSTVSRASSFELCEIWHRRMGHMYRGALRTLRKITTGVQDFSTDHFDTYRGCAMGKFAKSPFPSSDSRATGVLDLIPSDVSGRMSHVSLSGYEYYVLFIDDHSRRTWIYFLKTKSEVFKRFQEFRALVETQTGRKIKSLRSDNGGEYTLGEFVDYCAEAGIRREFTVPYNPQQNRVVERKNRSIVGATKAMLHDKGLPLFLWEKACNTAVYLQNRSPHRALGHMTPEEAFSGKKPDIGHLRIFGCITYSYIPKEKRTKLEPTIEKGIFVGYSETSKAFWIYIPAQRKVVVRRDVNFEEDRAFRRSWELESISQQWLDEPEGWCFGQHAEQFTRESTDGQFTRYSASTALGAGRRATNRQSGVQAPDGDEEEEFHSPMGEACSGKRKPKWLQDTLRDATSIAEPKRPVRESRPPERFCSYMAMATSILDFEPSSYDEAASQQVWREAMQEEYSSIMKNDVWEVVPRPESKSLVTSRWLYKVKHAADGSIEKLKVRFVARGFSQVEGVDYEDSFALVARYTSICSIISITAEMGWKIHQMDVKTAFLNGFIQEEVYIEQPQVFEVHGKESHVCRLKKALYGLKQLLELGYSR